LGYHTANSGITATHCVKTQKSAVLSYFVAETWNHA